MHVIETVAAFAHARAALVGDLGLVPTMGYLHAGHLALVAQARRENSCVAVSIFVNPTQFAAHEDLARYPRDLPRDLAMLEQAGVDLVFVPPPAVIYPPHFATSIDVGRVAVPLEGAARPGHFAGVATVVCKLCNITRATRAYFGQKDAQQTLVIRRMAIDLNLPTAIVICPTVREPDGLALSSRNVYLSHAQRTAAPILYRALCAAAAHYQHGERVAARLRNLVEQTIASEPLAQLEYISVADRENLHELDMISSAGALVSLVVRFGNTRLLDNILLSD